MNIVACGAEHGGRLAELFSGLSERHLTLIKEDLADPRRGSDLGGTGRTTVGGARRAGRRRLRHGAPATRMV
jgi:hypothetical protein